MAYHREIWTNDNCSGIVQSVEQRILTPLILVRVQVPDPIIERYIMNKVKVSLREIMEDDHHPLMEKWVEELLPLIEPIIKAQNPKLFEEEDSE